MLKTAKVADNLKRKNYLNLSRKASMLYWCCFAGRVGERWSLQIKDKAEHKTQKHIFLDIFSKNLHY